MNQTPKAKIQSRMTVITIVLLSFVAIVLILLTAIQDRRQARSDWQDDGTTDHETTVTTPDMRGSETEKIPFDTEMPSESKPATQPETQASVIEEEIPVIAPDPVETLPTFIAPVSGALLKEHSVDVPVYSLTMEDYRTHSGIDITASAGTSVRAAADGVIHEIWLDPMMGTCLSIKHTGGAISIYRNLAPELPDGTVIGRKVAIGEIIASVGESALAEIAEESHLHYELTVDGQFVDPCDYMLIGSGETTYEG